MRNTRTWQLGIVCLLLVSLAVPTLSQTPRGAQSRYRDLVRRMQERRQAREQRNKERERRPAPSRVNPEKRRKEAQERARKTREEFLREKAALNPTPGQWEVIKPLLEKIRQLRNLPRSTSGMSLTSTSTDQRTAVGSRRVGMWKWMPPWKEKPTSQWTAGQRTAQELIDLVGNQHTTDEAFAKKIDALRQCRRKEAAEKNEKSIEKTIAETQEQLRQVLTTRQEAALVLMRWL